MIYLCKLGFFCNYLFGFDEYVRSECFILDLILIFYALRFDLFNWMEIILIFVGL